MSIFEYPAIFMVYIYIYIYNYIIIYILLNIISGNGECKIENEVDEQT